ncbi:MAG: hypothetical protein ABW352_21510 [Polyangiales bacterium]
MAFDWRARAILWLDGGAAFLAGATVLAVRGWLAQLYAFAPALVFFLGAMNLLYASYSGALAVLASRGVPLKRRAIDVLVIANAGWVAVCAGLVAWLWSSASVFGLLHVAFEGAFVGTLALAEARFVRPCAQR